MRRRTVLAGSAGLIAGLAGCSGILGDSDGGNGEPSSPAEVARALVEALIEGDVDAANDLIHPDAPAGGVDQSNVESFQSVDASIEDVAVESRDESTAMVHVVVRAETGDGESGAITFPFELRKHDGEWLVYEDHRATGSPPRAPSVQWESSERTDADGNVTAVAFQHGGGDTVPSGTLAAHVEGLTASAPEGTDVQTGTTLVVPTDESGDSISASADVFLIWSDPDGGQSQELAVHSLTSPAAGTLGQPLRIDS